MKLQVEWIIRFSNDSICIFLSPFLKIIQQRTCNLSNCQSLLSPLSFSFLLKREEKLPSAVDSRKLTNRFLSAAKSSTLCDPRYRVRQGSQNVQTYKDETVSRPFREKTKWMDKCSTFKSSLSKSHRFYICNSFWKKPLNPWPRKGGGNTLFNPVCALTNGWMQPRGKCGWA